MNRKTKSFPLPLSSVMGRSSSEKLSGGGKKRWAGLQTAVQNTVENRELERHVEKPRSLPETAWNGSSPLRSLHAMVDRLMRAGIRDTVVLEAMGKVPRHLFVEAGLSGQAYADIALPIGSGQTISKPSTVAKMLEALRTDTEKTRWQKVLEIGTGCGYQAAILAKMAHEVYSVERIRALHELARRNLRPMRIANLRLHYGDGMLGLPQVAPFDGIIVAAAGVKVPDALLMQLTVGGRLIAPIGEERQTLQLIERVAERQWKKIVLDDCHFVPLREGTV